MNGILLNPIPSPCKDCKDRYVGCHGECSKYLEFRELVDEHNKVSKGTKDIYYDYKSQKRTKLLKWLKNQRSN